MRRPVIYTADGRALQRAAGFGVSFAAPVAGGVDLSDTPQPEPEEALEYCREGAD